MIDLNSCPIVSVNVADIKTHPCQPRLPQNSDGSSLVPDIATNGLLEILTVIEREDGSLDCLEGHRRKNAIDRGLNDATYRARFEALFPKGQVKVRLVKGISQKDEMRILHDHGTSRGLTHPHELRTAVRNFTLSNWGLTETMEALRDVFDGYKGFSPTSAKAKQYDKALADGNIAEANRLWKQMRHGLAQVHERTALCPFDVYYSFDFHATGRLPEGVTDPKKYPQKPLTNDQVKTLFYAHKKDMEIMGKDGVPAYSQHKPGPGFKAAWDLIVATSWESGDTPPKPIKPWTTTKLESQLPGMSSKGFRHLITQHMGKDANVEAIKEADDILGKLETIQTARVKEYQKIVRDINKVFSEIQAAEAAAEEKTAEAA